MIFASKEKVRMSTCNKQNQNRKHVFITCTHTYFFLWSKYHKN